MTSLHPRNNSLCSRRSVDHRVGAEEDPEAREGHVLHLRTEPGGDRCGWWRQSPASCWVCISGSALPPCERQPGPASSAPISRLNEHSPSTQAMAAPVPDVPPPAERGTVWPLHTVSHKHRKKHHLPDSTIWGVPLGYESARKCSVRDGTVFSVTLSSLFTQPMYMVRSLTMDGVLPSADV